MTEEKKLVPVERKAVPRLEQFQRNASKILWESFQNGRFTFDHAFDELLKTDSEAVQAYMLALEAAELARKNLLIKVYDYD